MNIRLSILLAVALSLLYHANPLVARSERGAVGKTGVGAPTLSGYDIEFHNVNRVSLSVWNTGQIGMDLSGGHGYFPSNTGNNYVFGTGLWMGARFDADGDGDRDKVFNQAYETLSGGSEFREGSNDQTPDDPLARVFDSTDPDDLSEWPDHFAALDYRTGEFVPYIIGDQDLVTTYTTKDATPVFGMYQMPVEVRQRSVAFRGGLAGQAILFFWDMNHWGDRPMDDCWIGYDSDMDVGSHFSDDISSFVRDRVTPEGDTVRVNMGYAWDSDFEEANFTGDPGFVGIAYLRSPGNPFDGIDNDGDGVIDESPYNGIDDDGDGQVDEPDEVDELGLINYCYHCGPSVPCEVIDPQSDPLGYDLLSCISENNPDSGSMLTCLESTEPHDDRFMISSGPFDWLPGHTQQVVMAIVFAHPTGDRYLPFVGNPPRPDPNDDDLAELLAVKETVQGLFDLDFKPAEPPPAPTLTLIPGDWQVTLLWDDHPLRTPDPDYEAFVEIDPEYREYDFQGFRVWRSRTGEFSRLGDPDHPDWPLTPEAVQQNNDIAGLDLTLLGQYDLADGIVTEWDGVSCEDSVVTELGDIIYTECDTFNIGSDTGLRYSYIDRGDSIAPLTNGFRYYYAVTAYDYNSDVLPTSRLSLDSGLSFSRAYSVVPRSHASSFVDAFARIEHVDSTGTALDDTSSIFLDPGTRELDPPETVHASNALVGFAFDPGIPEAVSDDGYTLILGDVSRVDNITNRFAFHVADPSGAALNTGANLYFHLAYDGEDVSVQIPAFDREDSTRVLFTVDLAWRVDHEDFVYPDAESHFLAINGASADMVDSLGYVALDSRHAIMTGFRASDLRMEWIAVDEHGDSLTLEVLDLDNRVGVPFGEGIVDSIGQTLESEMSSNWSFVPLGGGVVQPGGRYFLTTSRATIVDLWLCGVELVATGMDRMPLPGDVWTLRQVAMTVESEVETTFVEPDSIVVDTTTTYVSGQRPPVPGGRYRLDTRSGGPRAGEVDMSAIRVVPNPYLASAAWDIGPSQRRLEFINLPPACTIRIYTISGNLVRILDHTSDEGGTEVYDLRTRENRRLASGNYYYHVTTPDGRTHLGRFAVVQ